MNVNDKPKETQISIGKLSFDESGRYELEEVVDPSVLEEIGGADTNIGCPNNGCNPNIPCSNIPCSPPPPPQIGEDGDPI